MSEEFKPLKLTKWVDEPSINDLDTDLKGASSAKLTQVAKIDNWLDLLNATGKYKPSKRAGRSTVQPRLAKKQASWRYSALSDPFLSGDETFQIKPRTYRDRKAAHDNGVVLNYQFDTLMDKTKFINDMVHTAVDEGTVIMKTEWFYEERKVTRSEPVYEYEEATDINWVQTVLREAILMQQEDPDQFLQLPDEIQEAVLATAQNGRPILVSISGYEDVEYEEIVHDQPYWTVCDYQNITFDPTCKGDLQKAQFAVEEYETSIAELKKNPIYQNLDKVKVGEPADTVDDEGSSFQFQDDARKKVNVKEYWGFWDIHGDGKTVPIIAAWVGDTMIRMEENPLGELPYEVVPYEPVTGSLYGTPDADLLEENQAIIGALTRGMVDSMARSANAQVGMRKDALDVLNKRKYIAGENYEYNPTIVDSRAAIIEHSYPELPASTFNMLTMFNSEAEATTGIRSWTGGDAGSSLGNTAAAANGIISAASKRELDVLRRLSGGIERLARKTLILNSLFLSDETVIRITDEKYARINRDNLKGSFDIKLTISTSDSDNIKAQELAFMLQTMGATLPFDMLKGILAEIATLRNMPDLAKMIETYQPQPDPMDEIEVQLKQAELQKMQIENQHLMIKMQLDQAKATEVQAKATKTNLDTVEQEKGVTQAREIEKLQAQAQGNAKRDIMKTALDAAFKTNKTGDSK